jgi:murein L,D-transpeptidase YcbB/YkuD
MVIVAWPKNWGGSQVIVRLATAAAIVLALTSASSAQARDQTVVQQGLDMVVIDAEAMPQEPELAAGVPEPEDVSWSGAPVDLLKPIHHLYTDLRRQLIRYQMQWSSLPQVRVLEKGGSLDLGASNGRVAVLRSRLGLGEEGMFDLELQSRVAAFQAAHGLAPTGKLNGETMLALNRGAAYYERRLLLNMERARRLPAPESAGKYILVDAGSARLWMYDNGQPVDSMKVIVGKADSATPMMAAMMRYASVNPYWNVPPDLVAKLIAPRVLSDGVSYLSDRRYEVLDSWEDDAKVMHPARVDWKAVADGKLEIRVRQLPGGANSMGAIKFMLPNDYGIYLHDTPNKAAFNEESRWVSNGCVRVEDAERLARWIFGAMPRSTDPDREQYQPLREAIPVYMTYLTVGTGAGEPTFRADPYDRDNVVLERFADAGDGMQEAKPRLQIEFAKSARPVALADAPRRSSADVKKVVGTGEIRPASTGKVRGVPAKASAAKVTVPSASVRKSLTAAKPLPASTKIARSGASGGKNGKVGASSKEQGGTSTLASAKPIRGTATTVGPAIVARPSAGRAMSSSKPVKSAPQKERGTAAVRPRTATTLPGKVKS